MKVNVFKRTCLLFFFVASNLLAQGNPQIQQAEQVLQDSAQVSAIQDTSNVGTTQPASPPKQNDSKPGLNDMAPWLVALLALLFGIYQFIKRREDAKQKKLGELEAEAEHKKSQQQQKTKTAEQRYCDALEAELGSIKILGSHEIENVPVNVLDAFVSLDLSESWRSESRFDPRKIKQPHVEAKHATPEGVMKRAFRDYRLLLLIGDPGSGKTTLMKYYAMSCLKDEGCKKFGFLQPVLPLYFPLRDLEPRNATPGSLPENLARWAKKHVLDISAEEFHAWLHERPDSGAARRPRRNQRPGAAQTRL